MNESPPVTEELVKYVERKFPDKCPDGDDLTTWLRRQGELKVVRFLRRLHEIQIQR